MTARILDGKAVAAKERQRSAARAADFVSKHGRPPGLAVVKVGDDPASARVRPLAWGLTAALAGTLVANAFYLTMTFYYFYVLGMLILAAPIVFGRRLSPAPAPSPKPSPQLSPAPIVNVTA